MTGNFKGGSAKGGIQAIEYKSKYEVKECGPGRVCPVSHTLWWCAAVRSQSFGQTFNDRKTCNLNSSYFVVLF